MALTNEKIEKIVNCLKENESIASLDAAEAVIKFKEVGIDVTVDELSEISSLIKKAAEDNKAELSEDSLENVAGGFGPAVFLPLIGGAVAYAIYRKLRW